MQIIQYKNKRLSCIRYWTKRFFLVQVLFRTMFDSLCHKRNSLMIELTKGLLYSSHLCYIGTIRMFTGDCYITSLWYCLQPKGRRIIDRFSSSRRNKGAISEAQTLTQLFISINIFCNAVMTAQTNVYLMRECLY